MRWFPCWTRWAPPSSGTYSRAALPGVEAAGDPLPGALLDSIRRTKLALKGPLTTPVGGGFRSVNVRLREEFHLYANLRPAHTLVPGGRFENIDLVLIRENLEGLYVAFEHYIPIGDDPHAVAISSGVNTRDGSRSIARYAFEHALKLGRKKVTIVHKANVLKALTGVFLDTARDVAQGIRGQARLRRPDRRRLRHAARAEPLAVRRDRYDEPVRRYPVRSDRRPGGWPGCGARCQHRREGRHFRSGARLGAGYRGQGPRQPDRAAARRRPDAGPRRPHRPGTATAEGDRYGIEPGQCPHRRPGWHRVYQ